MTKRVRKKVNELKTTTAKEKTRISAVVRKELKVDAKPGTS